MGRLAGMTFIYNTADADRILKREVVPIAVNRAADLTVERARANLMSTGRIDSGNLLESIQRLPMCMIYANSVRQEVGSPLPYAIYQEMGIGPVYPVRAKVLRFQPRGSSSFVFAKSTKGFPGAFYLTRALQELTSADFTF